MSQTTSADIVSRTYWEYVASAMVDGLERIIQGQAAPAAAISRRVYVDAQRFFDLALEAARDGIPQNPSASIANYIIAANAANVQVQSPGDRLQLRSRLEQFVDLLNTLQTRTTVVTGELQDLTDLKCFFAEVQHDAAAEAYERMATEIPQTSMRLR
jgi:hypothetical protein